MSQQEEWRPVVGFPDYRVSSEGRVVSLRKWRGQAGPRLLRTHPNGFGYPVVQLYGCDGTHRNRVARLVHTLVATAFLGPRPEGMEVCHFDGDPANPRLSNLRYDTPVANARDKVRHGTHPGQQTHCVYGHEFNDVNTYFHEAARHRYCRPCARDRGRLYRERKALRAASVPTMERAA